MSALRSLIRPQLLGLALLAACSSSTEPTVPGTNPEVANIQDNFQFQTSNVTNATTTLNYTWRNTGTSASVNQSTTVTAGALSLVVLDANGQQVYSRSLAENGTFNTTAGTSGNWTVRVVFQGHSGTVNFRVQKL